MPRRPIGGLIPGDQFYSINIGPAQDVDELGSNDGPKNPAPQDPDETPTLPDYEPTPGTPTHTPVGVVRRSVLNRTSRPLSKLLINVVATGAPLPLIYGTARVGAKVGWPFVTDNVPGKIILPTYWAEGEVDDIQIYISGEHASVPPWEVGTLQDVVGDSVDFEHYYGTDSQGLSPILSSGLGYTDTHPNVAYSVLRFGHESFLNNIVAEIRGRKVYDPRKDSTNGGSGTHRVNDPSTWEYSANPVLCAADYHQKHRGTYETIRWSSVITCADHADEEIEPGVKRYEIGIVIDRRRPFEEWLAKLAEHAGIFYHYEGAELVFTPDAPVQSVDGALSESDCVRASLKLEMTDADDVPDQVIVRYTRTDTEPWSDDYAQTPTPLGGAKNPQVVHLDGIQSYQQAYRAAVTRLNKMTLMNLVGSMKSFDEALNYVPGNVIEITHSRGLTAKKMRVVSHEAYDLGRYEIGLAEYQPNVWEETVQTEPVYPDSSIPSPASFPIVTGLTASERLWQDQTGQWHTVFDVSFDGSDWPHVAFYRFRVERTSNSELLLEGTTPHEGEVTHSFVTPPSQQGVEWTIKVWVVNRYGGHDPATFASATVTGNPESVPPLDIPLGTLVGYEFDQFVQLQWGASADTDLAGYRIKRISESDYQSDPSGAWTHANAVTVTNRVDSELILLSAQPVGTWRYGVRAFDRQGNLSPTPRWWKQEVTANQAGSIGTQKLDADALELTNMKTHKVYGVGVRTYTNDNGSWVDRFGVETNPWPADQTEPWAYGMTVASAVKSEEWDTEADRSGNWAWQVSALEQFGGASVGFETEIALASAYPTFTTHSGQAITAEGRYMRAVLDQPSATLNYGFSALFPIDASYQGQIKEDIITVNIPADPGPSGHQFSWTKNFVDKPQYSFVVEDVEPVVIGFENVDNTGGFVRAWAGQGHSTATPGDEVATTIIITARGP